MEYSGLQQSLNGSGGELSATDKSNLTLTSGATPASVTTKKLQRVYTRFFLLFEKYFWNLCVFRLHFGEVSEWICGIFSIEWMNEWIKQLLIQNMTEQLQDKHVTKAFIWIKNNSTIVLSKLEMSYSLMSYSLKLKMKWSLSKKRTIYLKKAEILIYTNAP